jgi:hypothetical protein
MKRYRSTYTVRDDFTKGKLYTLLGKNEFYILLDNNGIAKNLTDTHIECWFELYTPFKYGK